MASEDTFNGAKNAFSFLGVYMNNTAQEIGLERALALFTKTCQALGIGLGKMKKEQAGDTAIDAQTAHSLVRGDESLGAVNEVLEESPTLVRFKCMRCPAYEGAQMAGVDQAVIESMCRNGSIAAMDAAVKQLNPRLSYQLIRYRSGADDFCEEQISLA